MNNPWALPDTVSKQINKQKAKSWAAYFFLVEFKQFYQSNMVYIT